MTVDNNNQLKNNGENSPSENKDLDPAANQHQLPQKKWKNCRSKKRAELILSMNQEIATCQKTQARTDAFRMARLVAIMSLPVKRTQDRDRSKVFRLGKNLWVKVTLTAQKGQTLPFGEDRFVLAGIMHLAIESDWPVVYFKHACDLLKMFDVTKNNQGYRLLRERFKRLSGIAITTRYAKSERELNDVRVGENMFVIHRYSLPTKQQIQQRSEQRIALKKLVDESTGEAAPETEFDNNLYGVKLSGEFWNYIREPKNQLVVPVNLMKLFRDRPIGWDYAFFLVARCGAAKSYSKIPHETIMALFKEGKEEDRQTIARLKQYHEQIMLATDHRLNAEIVEDGYFLSGEMGRKKKRWSLVVGPSDKLIWSGKRPDCFPPEQT